MEVSCQCGNIQFLTPQTKPLSVYFCHCIECRAQSASAFGTSAIFPASPLFPLTDELKSKLKIWTRPTDAGNTLKCYFCPECGSRLIHHGILKDGKERETISIKGGVIKGLDWKGVKHIWCKSAVVPIPEGVEKWDKEPGVPNE
jgi:hypothetical protein